jgi:hypothetical protein
MSNIRDFFALIQPIPRNADPSRCRLTDWRMTVSLAWVGDEGPNRCVYLDNPGTEIAPKCEKDAVFWSEPWDGTMEALRELKARAEDAECAHGHYGEYIVANTVAIFPAFLERIDRTECGNLNAGLHDWLDRLDEAHLAQREK